MKGKIALVAALVVALSFVGQAYAQIGSPGSPGSPGASNSNGETPGSPGSPSASSVNGGGTAGGPGENGFHHGIGIPNQIRYCTISQILC